MDTPPPAPARNPLLRLARGLGCLALLALFLLAGRQLRDAHKHENAKAARKALLALAAAQERFRTSDADRDGLADFGTLAELGQAELIDGVLAAGTKQGYAFALRVSASAPTARYLATAVPVNQDTGTLSFAMTQDGLVFSSPTPLTAGEDCQLPPGCQPTGE